MKEFKHMDNLEEELISFAEVHRKRHYHLIFITPDDIKG